MRAPSNTPPGQRSSVVGRSPSANRMPGPTETKYSTTSILRTPRSAKYGFSGLETRTSCPSISRTTASLLAAIAMLLSLATARGRRSPRGRAGQPVLRHGQVDQVRVDVGGHARRLRVARVPLTLPREKDAGVQIARHVHRTGQRRHRIAGISDDEDRRRALRVPLRQRRPGGLPRRAGVEADRRPGTEQRVLLAPVLGQRADLALRHVLVGALVGAV